MINRTDFRHKTIIGGLPYIVVLIFSLNAFAFTRMQNSDGTICEYWVQRNLSFVVNDKCSKDVNQTDCYQAVQSSIMAWMGHPCSDLTLSLVGSTLQTFTDPKNATGLDCINLIVWRESNVSTDPGYWKYDSSAIALTTDSYDIDTGEIFDADIEVNGADYKFSTSIPVPSGYMDIQSTLTHEMGHCIGLGHSTDPTAIMYAYAKEGENSKRTLSQDDINGLCYIYPAGEKTPLCSGQQEITVAASCPQNKNNGGGGGCVVATNSNSELPELALGAMLLFFLRIYHLGAA